MITDRHQRMLPSPRCNKRWPLSLVSVIALHSFRASIIFSTSSLTLLNVLGDLFQDLLLVGSKYASSSPISFKPMIFSISSILVSDSSRQNMAGSQFTHDACFDLYFLNIFFQFNFMACFQFRMAVYTLLLSNSCFALSVTIASSASGVVFTFGKPRLSASFCPFFAIAIAFKQYFFAAHNVFADHMHDGDLFLLAFFNQGIHIFFEILQVFLP